MTSVSPLAAGAALDTGRPSLCSTPEGNTAGAVSSTVTPTSVLPLRVLATSVAGPRTSMGICALICEGETVTEAKLHIGFNFRGIEHLAETRNYIQVIALMERVCGICSFIHTLTLRLDTAVR